MENWECWDHLQSQDSPWDGILQGVQEESGLPEFPTILIFLEFRI